MLNTLRSRYKFLKSKKYKLLLLILDFVAMINCVVKSPKLDSPKIICFMKSSVNFIIKYDIGDIKAAPHQIKIQHTYL